MPLGVEEVGRLQVAVALGVERRDRGRVHDPLDRRVSPPRIVPVKPGTRPFTVARPVSDSNSSDDQTGSIVHVPLGIVVAGVSATMVIHVPPCVRYH